MVNDGMAGVIVNNPPPPFHAASPSPGTSPDNLVDYNKYVFGKILRRGRGRGGRARSGAVQDYEDVWSVLGARGEGGGGLLGRGYDRAADRGCAGGVGFLGGCVCVCVLFLFGVCFFLSWRCFFCRIFCCCC